MMDIQRMDILFKQVRTMDSSLVDILDNYKSFSESALPVITVLCSDNTLRQRMDMLFGEREDLTAKVYGTFNEQVAENELNALMSDAVVVCTKAKNIAPKDMYDCLKKMSGVNKPVYVLLAGWESLPKTPEMLKQRRERVNTEFPFARIVSITNVFTQPMEGLQGFEDAVNDLCRRFTDGFEKLHSDQDEALYGYVKEYVNEYYIKARSQINNVLAALNKCQETVIIKNDFYKARFSSLDVRFQETVDLIAGSVKDITYYSLIDSSTNETLDDLYSESGAKAQTKAKRLTAELMVQRILALGEEKENSIRVAAAALVNECESDIAKISDKVAALPYVPQSDIEAFSAACRNTGSIAGIPDRYADYKDALIVGVAKRVPAKIFSYEYDMETSIKMRDFGKNIMDILGNMDKDSDPDSERSEFLPQKPGNDLVKVFDENPQGDLLAKKPDTSKLKELVDRIVPKDSSAENDKALMLENFQNDVNAMLSNAKNAVSTVAHDCIRSIKKDIERTCADMLKSYFDKVLSTLSGVCSNTAKKLSEYDLE